MNKHRILTAILIVAMLLPMAWALPVAAAPPKPPARWTFMVYMNGDNNLEKYVTPNMKKNWRKSAPMPMSK